MDSSVTLVYTATEDQWADFLTKIVPSHLFGRHVDSLMSSLQCELWFLAIKIQPVLIVANVAINAPMRGCPCMH